MKYLNSAPFSSPPANNAYRENYPFGPSKFERELAEEKALKQIPRNEGRRRCLVCNGSWQYSACCACGGSGWED